MDKDKKEHLDKKWNKIVLKAIKDEEFKKALVKNPVNVMAENGLSIPPGCKAGESTGNRVGLQLPTNASDEIKGEAKWWRWRLDMIHEFGKEEKTGPSSSSSGAPVLDGSPEM